MRKECRLESLHHKNGGGGRPYEVRSTMSKTLFWYILRDLLKIFLMASGVLAGIMSFGGLFKPMTKHGLSGPQVLEMLAYLMPAMQTYSLPIAALFATTVVYGRLSSDNELTACRASGIGYPSLMMPAVVLGLALAIVSLLSLSLIVPHYTLKVEKVAFNSLADVVLKAIQRTHQLRLRGAVVYAESAQKLASPGPGEEAVVLHGPMICRYERDEKRMAVPTAFYTARSATVRLRQAEDHVEFFANLEDGASFPRDFSEASISGIGTASIGPLEQPSVIGENTKFMNTAQLKELYHDPMRSREIRDLYRVITNQEQQQEFLLQVVAKLRSGRQCRFEGEDEAYVVVLMPQVKVPAAGYEKVVLTSHRELEGRQVRLEHVRGGQVVATDEARQLTVLAQAEGDRMLLEFQLEDVLVGTEQGPRGGRSFSRRLAMAMPLAIVNVAQRKPEYYLRQAKETTEEVKELRRKLPRLRSGIRAEVHGRVSFAVSCLVLVVAGCALGMMFSTGNYLSAFALSVMPALLCIALIATGQHVCQNEPGSLKLGLAVVWSGNVLVVGLIGGLMGYLRRQ
jgi:lipopolysaccharide export LptBFGC system permease protein LptF